MFGKPIGKDERAPEDVVVFKSLFGFRPGVYLAALYTLLILASLFALLVLPGLLKGGSVVAFDSEPRGAAVRVDDVYVGATPCSSFVAAGRRSIAFVSPGFTDVVVEKVVGSRVFASLLFPRRDAVTAELRSDDPVAALALGAADYAAWTFAGEPTAGYQVPMALSEAAYRAAPAAVDQGVRTRMADVLRASARYAAYASANRDLLRATVLVDSAGLAPSPLGLLRSSRAILDYVSENEGSSAWLASSLASAAASELASSDWYAAENRRASALVAASRAKAPAAPSSRRVTVGPLNFREIPSGVLTPTGSFPRAIEVSSFFLAETEVDRTGWTAFVASHPEWSSGNREKLSERGFVSEEYLVGSPDPAYPAPSVPGVSWYAATAFCAWLSESLPSSLSGYEVRLPTEIEWERAARTSPTGVERLIGGLWEWCADDFAPLDFLPVPDGVTVTSPERSVRGGSWANPASSISVDTRASLPADLCSPFVGFRPAIARITSPKTEGR